MVGVAACVCVCTPPISRAVGSAACGHPSKATAANVERTALRSSRARACEHTIGAAGADGRRSCAGASRLGRRGRMRAALRCGSSRSEVSALSSTCVSKRGPRPFVASKPPHRAAARSASPAPPWPRSRTRARPAEVEFVDPYTYDEEQPLCRSVDVGQHACFRRGLTAIARLQAPGSVIEAAARQASSSRPARVRADDETLADVFDGVSGLAVRRTATCRSRAVATSRPRDAATAAWRGRRPVVQGVRRRHDEGV